MLLAGCATVVPPPAAAPVSATEAEAAWGRVLQRFVNERGEVDFQALSQDRADLDRYLPASTRSRSSTCASWRSAGR